MSAPALGIHVYFSQPSAAVARELAKDVRCGSELDRRESIVFFDRGFGTASSLWARASASCSGVRSKVPLKYRVDPEPRSGREVDAPCGGWLRGLFAFRQLAHEPDDVARMTEHRTFPAEIDRWNWAAFGLNWIWGIAHKSYFPLLVFVPFFGLCVPFIAGARGNRWAWQNGTYESVERFKHEQRRWARYTLIAYAGAALGAVALAFGLTAMLKSSEAYQLATARLGQDARVYELLGQPVEYGRVQGRTEIGGGGTGKADLEIPMHGAKADATAYVQASKRAGAWAIDSLILAMPDGRQVALDGPTYPMHPGSP